jgi:MFS superfamily sulfate permease-like transporter
MSLGQPPLTRGLSIEHKMSQTAPLPGKSASDPPTSSSKPVQSVPTFADSWRPDLVSGFLVFLIALPLCLGIAKGSQFPPITGVFTAILGGLIAGLFSNSELTIKGPAAGMIAIVAGAMTDPAWLGHDPTLTSAGYLETYRLVLAVGVAAGVVQILLGLFRAGILTEFFPMAPVHGLLASIGFIIISKQSYLLFGFTGKVEKNPIDALLQLRQVVPALDPKITTIGLTSLAILFAYPFLKKRVKFLGYLPAQLVVLMIAIPLGMAFKLPASQLVALPDQIRDAVVTPDFTQVFSAPSLKWVMLFCLVGSLESLLSAKAIDILDPWKRKTNMNRDLLGVGVANTAVAFIGGLPMISEILRSSANIGNGGRTRLSNLFHGLFLLISIVLLAFVVKMIPLAALGAMLVFAGFRLASPKEFIHMWHLGKEQFVVFVLTIACIFPHGELLLVAVGMAAELIINLVNGASLGTLFKPQMALNSSGGEAQIDVGGALTFANWIPFKKRLESLASVPTVTVDLSHAKLIDHTAMDKLVQSQREFSNAGRKLVFTGLEEHQAFGHEATSGRKLVAV